MREGAYPNPPVDESPLCVACELRMAGVTKKLLAAGAYVDVPRKNTTSNHSNHHLAIIHVHVGIALSDKFQDKI